MMPGQRVHDRAVAAAFDSEVKKCADKLFRIAFGYANGNISDAEEIYSKGLVKAWTAVTIGNCQITEKFSGFLCVHVSYAGGELIRERAKRSADLQDLRRYAAERQRESPGAQKALDPATILGRIQKNDGLWHCIDALPEQPRIIIELTSWGLTDTEIAEELKNSHGISLTPGNIRQIQKRSRDKLMKRLAAGECGEQ